MAQEALVFSVNRVAGTVGLDACGAANIWAGVSGHDLVGALNLKAGNPVGSWKALQGVLNQLSGTQGLGVDAAARAIP
jgi:hypothetical protein